MSEQIAEIPATESPETTRESAISYSMLAYQGIRRLVEFDYLTEEQFRERLKEIQPKK